MMISMMVIAFFFVALMIAIMAVGVYFGRPPIQGTCGGLNRVMGDKECQFCGGDADVCASRSGETRGDIGSNNKAQPHEFRTGEL